MFPCLVSTSRLPCLPLLSGFSAFTPLGLHSSSCEGHGSRLEAPGRTERCRFHLPPRVFWEIPELDKRPWSSRECECQAPRWRQSQALIPGSRWVECWMIPRKPRQPPGTSRGCLPSRLERSARREPAWAASQHRSPHGHSARLRDASSGIAARGRAGCLGGSEAPVTGGQLLGLEGHLAPAHHVGRWFISLVSLLLSREAADQLRVALG